jgi:non-heme chloroperoxidase
MQLQLARLLPLAVLLAAPLAARADGKRGAFTTTDGVRLSYVEAGSGPALVFVPGWMMPGVIWQPQIDHFAKKYRVVVLDPRSQGESDKPLEGHYPERRAKDIRELIEHLKLSNVTLVGWSLGVAEVLTYVHEYGTGGLRSLVLVDGFLGRDPSVEMYRGTQQWLHGLQTDRAKFIDGFVRGMYTRKHPEEYYRRIIAEVQKTPTNSAVVLLTNAYGRDYRPLLGRIDRPVLSVMPPNQKEAARAFKERLPGASVKVMDRCGHAMFVDNPGQFNRVVEEFLATKTGP